MLTTLYLAKNDHRWVTFISPKTMKGAPSGQAASAAANLQVDFGTNMIASTRVRAVRKRLDDILFISNDSQLQLLSKGMSMFGF